MNVNYPTNMKAPKIQEKTKKTLIAILAIFSFFLIRVWHLSVIQKDVRLEQAIRPQRRTLIEHPHRGGIYDRFGIPLAINKIKYNATIYYAQLRQIPSYAFDKKTGIKTFPRKEHIKKLSSLLSSILHIDADRIEDLIYSKASLFPHTPFIIKENIDEKTYYRLRMLERDWSGLHAEIDSFRYYPHGKLASSVIGYMGAINQNEYWTIAEEINSLKKILNEELPPPPQFRSLEEVHNRYSELKTKAYSINDLIGKWGIEGKCEHILRGNPGKKTFSVDIQGNFLQKLPDAIAATSGKAVISTLSAELQLFAEKLLAQEEKLRIGRSTIYDTETKTKKVLPQPLIKGGAIVAIEPVTGQIVALASHPRFNPNDFIPSSNIDLHRKKQKNIHKWLETPHHIGQIFDGHQTLSCEYFKDAFYKEKTRLSWDVFLQSLIPQDSPIYSLLHKISIKDAIILQEAMDDLLYHTNNPRPAHLIDLLFPSTQGHTLVSFFNIHEKTLIKRSLEKNATEISPLHKKLSSYIEHIPSNFDKLLIIDLCRMAVNSRLFSNDLIAKTSDISIHTYWDITKAYLRIEKKIKEIVFPLFTEHYFKQWLAKNQLAYIKKKRALEKKRKTYAHPYLDYFDKKRDKLFARFWHKNKKVFLYSYIYSITPDNKNLTSSIIANLPSAKEDIDAQYIQKHLHHLSYPLIKNFFQTMRSFSDLQRPLLASYPRLRNRKNPLEKDLAAAFYPKEGFSYARSYCFRHSAPPGSLFKPITAYAGLKERYLYLTQNNLSLRNLNPLTIIDSYRWDSHATKKGSYVVGYSLQKKPYTRFYKGGRLPRSAHYDIGQVDLIDALAHSSNPYFSLLAGECLSSPESLKEAAAQFGLGEKTDIALYGEYGGNLPSDLSYNKTGLYSFAIGHHSLIVTPLQMAVALSTLANGGDVLTPMIYHTHEKKQIKRHIFLPQEIQNTIMEGLSRVVWSDYGTARPEAIRKLRLDYRLKALYRSLKHQLYGKTGTAEIMFNPYILPSSTAYKYKHIWFGSIALNNDEPELVVIVYLPFGDAGKEAAPLAAQIIDKYRAIKKKHHTEAL